jgi:hypothetical protein
MRIRVLRPILVTKIIDQGVHYFQVKIATGSRACLPQIPIQSSTLTLRFGRSKRPARAALVKELSS